jgi:hypothetical protein
MPWWNDELANFRKRMRQAYRKWRKNKNNAASTTFQINESKMLFKSEAAKIPKHALTAKAKHETPNLSIICI